MVLCAKQRAHGTIFSFCWQASIEILAQELYRVFSKTCTKYRDQNLPSFVDREILFSRFFRAPGLFRVDTMNYKPCFAILAFTLSPLTVLAVPKALSAPPSQYFGIHVTTPGTQFDPAQSRGQTWAKVDTMLALPDIYKKQIWLRSGQPLWNIYRAPNGFETNADPLFNEDGFNAELNILGRCYSNGFNWLCPIIPGYPSSSADGYDPSFWNNLYTDQAHTQHVVGDELNKLRDTYRIPDLYYYLPRTQFLMSAGGVNTLSDTGREIESIVRKINTIAKLDFGWTDYQNKIAFQLGNEPCGGEAIKVGSFGALHPGGSQAGGTTIGGWDGLGNNYEKIFANINFGAGIGTPQSMLVGPALSLLSQGEGFADGFLGNRYGLQVFWGGGTPFSASFAELVSAVRAGQAGLIADRSIFGVLK
jgi:hypothetical protein